MNHLYRFTYHLVLESIRPLCFWLLVFLHIGLAGLLWALWRMGQ